MKINISLLLLLFIPYVTAAQKTWTLEECIQKAIRENLQLEQKNLDRKIMKAELRQSALDFLPSLNGFLDADKSFGRSIDPSTNGIVSTRLFQSAASLGSSLVLFQGFVNLNRLQYNRVNALKSALEGETLKNDIAFRVMNAYFDLCFARGQLSIARDQCSLSRMNLKKIRIMVDAGIRASTDIAEMEARLALDDFRLTQAGNTLAKSSLALRQMMNIHERDSFAIEYKIGSGVFEPFASPDPDSLYNLASAHLPQFREMAMDAKLSELNYAISKGGASPSLKTQAGYGTGFYDSYMDAFGKMIPFRDQVRNNAYQYVGLSMSIPLFNGGMTGKNIRTAKWNREKTTLENEIKKREFCAEIENACLAVKSAADEYHSAQLQEAASSLNQQLLEKKWEQGTANLLELSDARNRLASARAEMLRTLLQYELKRQTIRLYTGAVNY